jgi:hypothetical protein
MKINGIPSFVVKLLIILFFVGIVVGGTLYAMSCYTYRDAIIQGASTIALVFTLLLMMFQYMDSRDPIVVFSIFPWPQIDQEQGKWFMRTFVFVDNKSNFDATVWINLHLLIDGKEAEEVKRCYAGKEPWAIPANMPVRGARFEIYSVFDTTGKLAPKPISMSIEVKYRGSFMRTVKKKSQKWHFDFARMQWIYDVCV